MEPPFHIRHYLILSTAAAVAAALTLSCWGGFDDAYDERWDRTDKIVFESNRDDPNREIYIMNIDGSNETRLTYNPTVDSDPDLSPDGAHIVFATNRDGNYEIYIMSADGSGQINRTNNAADDAKPAWSPDGSRIAFVSTRDGPSEIYVMNADGTNVTRFTTSAGSTWPCWSPDGIHIAFQRGGNIWATDGTVESNLRPGDLPAWSPDGNYITYTAGGGINIMKSDGTNPALLVSNSTLSFWSPDGTHIVFQSGRDGNQEIYSMKSDGSGQMRLTVNTAVDGHPSWRAVSNFEW